MFTSLHCDYRVANKGDAQHVSAKYRVSAAGINEITRTINKADAIVYLSDINYL